MVGGYRDCPWAEDHDLWLRMLAAGCRIGKTPEMLVEWRDSPRRLTRSDPRYGADARMALRAHHLARLPEVRERGAVVAGAGPIGKSLVRALQAEGVALHGFLEVNPRRIGGRIHGLPVMESLAGLGHWTGAVVLGAVGIPGGRQRVRALALEAGRREGRDFWSVC